MDITFKSGEFLTLTATRTFALGNFGVTIQKDTDIEFDGSTVRYAGSEYAFPQFRGAAKVGWAILAADYEEGNPEYGRPLSANIKVRSATDDKADSKEMKAPVATETDERVVSSLTPATGSNDIAQSQDGVPVGRVFKTRAKADKTSLTAESARSAADIEVQITPGEGKTQEQLLASMSEPEQQAYLAKKAALSSRHAEPTTVATVKTAAVKQAEGMTVTQSVGKGVTTGGGGEAIASISNKQSTRREEDGIVFTNTNGPDQHEAAPHHLSEQPSATDGTEGMRIQIAKAICPEFPETYDFKATDRKKLARLTADFEDRHDIIRAVFAAESDKFKATLVQEFPEAFQR